MSSVSRFHAGPPVRLLLVEDHVIFAEATAEFLRGTGLEVQIAKSGESALEQALVFRPDIVLCDIRLPDMSGLDVARALRKNPVTENALIAIHTAMDETDIQTLERGFSRDEFLFVSKPLTNEKLNRLLLAFRLHCGLT
jgi:CheY-like chemotaxis protein